MAYLIELVNQVREQISLTHENVEEKKMFGGICFMVDSKMCVGVIKDQLMVRFDPELFEQLLETEECSPMDFTGKSMKGFVFVNVDVLARNNKLNFWIELALRYNPSAKASPKKKNKSLKK